MIDVANVRLIARRSKKYWVAALCAGSFACGHYLFGDDDADASESLLSQYQQATQQLVTEVQPPTARRQTATPTSTTNNSRPQPTKAEAAVTVATTPAPPQKSSRRVKPGQTPAPEAAGAKTGAAVANAEPPAKAETSATEQSPGHEPTVEKKAELAQQPPMAPAATALPPAAAETKPAPTVTYIEVPPQSAVTQRQLAPRMEIITPATSGAASPRAQDPAAQTVPFVTAKPVPMQSEVRTPANPLPNQPLPQIINVTRQAGAPLQPPKPPTLPSAVDEENLPPIVSPDQVPRPGTRKKPVQPASYTTPVLRIDLGKK